MQDIQLFGLFLEVHFIVNQSYHIRYLHKFLSFYAPATKSRGAILIYPLSIRSSVRIQIHGLSGYLLLQFWSYSFNIVQDFYTHNGGVHVHRILIFIKYSQNDRQLDLVILFVRPDIQMQIHGLSGYLLLQFWSYSFNIFQDVYTHNGGVHVHRILIFLKYSQNDRQLDFFVYLSFVCMSTGF